VVKSTRSMAIAAVILAAGSLAACSTTKTLNTDDVQGAIAKGLTDQVGGTFNVTCPSEITAEKGATFTCAVTDPADGTSATVTVTQEDADGKFNWKVTAAQSASAAPVASPSSS
jgi:predicted small secreted protein